ncbi:hypothetical protein EDB87DRAFT_1613192 [Lactarius vividus]|nr:hypothetical protein EDB87DRAFT_1613192 [Lactarius vividus]
MTSPRPEALHTLAEPVRTRLRSSQILISLPQVVSELVQNALDASASHIDVGVDCQEWECWVKDDGHGISKSGLELLSKSHEAGRYNTSRAYSLSSLDDVCTFGFRGEALSSAADVSCLEISSRTTLSQKTWSIITKNGQCLFNGPAARWRMERPGTVVYLRDVFHNLPIRRNSHPRPSKTMELVCRDIETLALVFPRVSFTLSAIRRPSDVALTDRVLNIPKTTTILSAFRHINGRNLVDEVDEISISSGAMKLEGFISLRGALTKAHQYIYINRHPLSPSHHLHRNINHAFTYSSFSRRVSSSDATDHSRLRSRRSPHKLDRKPIYALSLTIPPKDIDNCLEPGKSLIHVSNENDVMAFVDSATNAFLRRHRFISTEGMSTPRKRRKIISPDSSWDGASAPVSRQLSSSVAEVLSNASPMVREARNLSSSHFNPNNGSDEMNETWKDPNPIFIAETSTRHPYPRTSLSREGDDEDTSQAMVKFSRISLTTATSTDDKGEAPLWIVDALKDNSAYFVEERPIPSIPQQQLQTNFSSKYVTDEAYATRHRRLFDGSFSTPDETSTWSLQRGDISRMKVISQLDRKFIVCVVDAISESDERGQTPDCAKRILVLVDQHAASERVRVEGYLKDLCHHFLNAGRDGSRSTFRVKLEPPRPVLLSRREASILRSSTLVLGRWGFGLSWPETEDRDQNTDQEVYEQVLVHSVPQVVGEKLLTRDELRNFLREYTEQSGTDDVLPALGSEGQEIDQDSPTWHKALRWCPKGLLDLVNSRACRGAIMFNDVLSIDQCERLMSRLAETAFPFQCAHGRPSLVALTGTPGSVPRRDGRGREIDWAGGGSLLGL